MAERSLQDLLELLADIAIEATDRDSDAECSQVGIIQLGEGRADARTGRQRTESASRVDSPVAQRGQVARAKVRGPLDSDDGRAQAVPPDAA